MILGITGVPGTGKTSLAKALAKRLSWQCLSLSNFLNELREKEYSKDWDSFLVDEKELEKKVKEKIKEMGGSVIIEGHLLADMDLDCDLVIVMRCPIDILEQRLATRGYSKRKIKENIEAELIDYCGFRFDHAIYLDGSAPLEKNVELVLTHLKKLSEV